MLKNFAVTSVPATGTVPKVVLWSDFGPLTENKEKDRHWPFPWGDDC